MPGLRRREFLQTATLGTAAAFAGSGATASANEKVVLGIIGTGGQGRHHVESYRSLPEVEVAYVCDVDENRLARANQLVPRAKSVSDLRRILDDKSVDAVSIATPDHWHAPAALLALDAGKHVYVEKPCSHNVREGRWLVETAKRTGKLVQHGTQSRSAPLIQAGIEVLRSGLIGTVLVARAWNVQYRPSIGKAKPTEPPASLNYDTWVGPAPMVPYQANRQHSSWHWWYEFGTGDAGNDGVHEIDIARWGLGVETHPSRVAAVGGKYFHDDDQQFPDTMTAVFEYPGDGQVGQKRQLLFEMRLWSHYYPYHIDNGNEFLGTKGRMLLTKRGKLEVFDERGQRINVKIPDDKSVAIRPHQQNFVDAIREAKELRANALTAHLSATLPHLGNVACRVGRSFVFDPATEQIAGDAEANQLLQRTYRDGHWGTPKLNSRA
jgi:predicted dehydrogenase